MPQPHSGSNVGSHKTSQSQCSSTSSARLKLEAELAALTMRHKLLKAKNALEEDEQRLCKKRRAPTEHCFVPWEFQVFSAILNKWEKDIKALGWNEIFGNFWKRHNVNSYSMSMQMNSFQKKLKWTQTRTQIQLHMNKTKCKSTHRINMDN